MNSPQEVGNIIKINRLKQNLTQKELAKFLFVEETTVSRWECGLGYPSTNLFDPICDVLNISLPQLLGNDMKTKYKCEIILSAVSLLLASLIFVLLFLGGNLFTSNNLVCDIFSIIFVSFLTISLATKIIFILKKEPLLLLDFISFLLSCLCLIIFVLSSIIGNSLIHFSIIIIVCVTLSYLLAIQLTNNVPNFVSNSRILILKIVCSLLFIPFGFLLYSSATAIALFYSSDILYVLFYIFGIVFNLLPLIYFYRLMPLKTFIVVSLTTFIILNTIFVLHLFQFRVFNIIFDVFIYIGIANSPFIYFLFTSNLKRRIYDN